jgi:hypothetical protein
VLSNKNKKAIGITYMGKNKILQEYGIKVRGHKKLIILWEANF